MATLCARGYDRFLSLHSFYAAPLAQVLDQARSDLAYVRRQIAAAMA
jgi:hypothetical protein